MKKWLSLALFALALGIASGVLAQPAGRILSCDSARASAPADMVLLTASGGQTANGDSLNWLSTGKTRHALAVQYVITGTATVELFNSIDGGTTWDNVANTVQTSNERFTIEDPIGHFKTTVSGISAGNVTVKTMCGASVGGRP